MSYSTKLQSKLRAAARFFIPRENGSLPIAKNTFSQIPYQRLDAANSGGAVNRLRCLMTSTLFSKQRPHLYWPTSYDKHYLFEYDKNSANKVFGCKVTSPDASESLSTQYQINYDWRLLSPGIMRLKGDSRSFCIDALNGDGLKNAESLYLLPDAIFYEFKSCIERLFSVEFTERLKKLSLVCQDREYGIFALRFWVDCPRSLNSENNGCRPKTKWRNVDEFSEFLEIICFKKTPRRPPSLAEFRAAKSFMKSEGIDDILFTSDRWFNQGIYDRKGSVRNALAKFPEGLERTIATLYIIANAKILCRSKDSTYSHLPLLLGDKWSTRVINL